jgi:hypothetical protein
MCLRALVCPFQRSVNFLTLRSADLIRIAPQDCDMPTELSSPDARPEAGVDHVDVMKFLGLKRAEAINVRRDGK